MKLIIYAIGLLYCLFLFFFQIYEMSIVMPLTVVTIILSVYNMLTLFNGRLSLSTVLLIYTMLTQFGLIIPYYYYGANVVDMYQEWTVVFLKSNQLGKAILIGNIAIYSYDISRLCFKHFHRGKANIAQHKGISVNMVHPKKMAMLSTALLVLVLLFFLFHISTGGMLLFGTYEQFMASSAAQSTVYHYILVTFYVATLYLSASGNIKENLGGWLLWLLIVAIFAVNGNKGEFLYSLLAVFGLKGVQGHKISRNLVIGGILLLFLIIPSITALRNIGISQNINGASFSAFGAFTEMGMQLRTTVYTLENLENGLFDYLYGQSYWQPIINIFTPFLEHNIATAHVRAEFPGFGYNQVAESFLNFNVIGVILFYSLLGGLLYKYENLLARNTIKLAYLGTITCVLINASRNYFVFVPGQILMVSIFYWFTKFSYKKGSNSLGN